MLHLLHVHSHDYRDIKWTLNLTPCPSQPQTMHISRYNMSILRMWTDLGKTSLYSKRVPLTKNRLQTPVVACNYEEERGKTVWWCVWQLSSHQYGQGASPGGSAIHVNLLVESVVGSCPLALRGFYLGAPVFLSPQTPTFQTPILSRMADKETP